MCQIWKGSEEWVEICIFVIISEMIECQMQMQQSS